MKCCYVGDSKGAAESQADSELPQVAQSEPPSSAESILGGSPPCHSTLPSPLKALSPPPPLSPSLSLFLLLLLLLFFPQAPRSS
ncbi:hypothetical protein SRHO_G00311610 [Serrasalmus rhombeus]